jgi:crotonobetainyl-CoA:carnitine CoA-transferase CaiB-like acyl-CoA transferase
MSYLNYLATWHLTTGYEPKRRPLGAHQTIVPSQMFATADSWIMVMAQQDKFYEALVNGIGMPELARDSRFRTMQDRYDNRDSLLEILTETFKGRTTDEWLTLLEHKVPVAPINSIPQALRDPQVEALGLIVGYDHPSLGQVRQVGPPFKISGYQPRFKPASPMGDDTDRILTEYAGLTPDELPALRKAGIV